MSDFIDWESLKENPEFEVAKACSIDTGNLDEALAKHAAIYGYVYGKYEQARAREAKLEWLYEQERAESFKKLREEGEAIGSAQEKVELDSRVKETREDYLKAEEWRRLLWSLVTSLEARKDMLVQLSSRQRARWKQES